MAACPFERAKYLPSKWILRHDVAHFETELSIKLFLPMVKPPLYFLDFCQCGFGTPPQKKTSKNSILMLLDSFRAV
jgi:hypothetical protein